MINKYTVRAERRWAGYKNGKMRITLNNHSFYFMAWFTKVWAEHIYRNWMVYSNTRVWIEKTRQYRRLQENKELDKVWKDFNKQFNN